MTEEDGKILRDLEEINYEQSAESGKKQKRLIERLRMLYRPDDLGVFVDDPLALLTLGTIEPLALPGETYKLSFTPGLLTQVFQRNGAPLLPDPANVLGGQGADRGGYVDLDSDGHWWIPTGRVFHSPNAADTAVQELDYARQHFFLPQRYRDPFGQTSTVTNDTYDLLMTETVDALPVVRRGRRAKDETLQKMSMRIQGRAVRRAGELLREIEPAKNPSQIPTWKTGA